MHSHIYTPHHTLPPTNRTSKLAPDTIIPLEVALSTVEGFARVHGHGVAELWRKIDDDEVAVFNGLFKREHAVCGVGCCCGQARTCTLYALKSVAVDLR